jgi:hypothetical protein
VGCEMWRLEEGKCCVGCACVDSMGGRERLIGGFGDRLPEVLMLVDVDKLRMYPSRSSRMHLGYAPPHIRYGTYISIAPLSPSNPEFFTALLFSRYSDGIGSTAAHISRPGGMHVIRPQPATCLSIYLQRNGGWHVSEMSVGIMDVVWCCAARHMGCLTCGVFRNKSVLCSCSR